VDVDADLHASLFSLLHILLHCIWATPFLLAVLKSFHIFKNGEQLNLPRGALSNMVKPFP
jgi:hypothetical protein